MVARDKPGTSSNVKWFVILSIALIGGIFVTPTLPVGTFAQSNNAMDAASNDTSPSDAKGADTNQTITQVAEQIARDDKESTAVKQVLVQIAAQIDAAGGDGSQVINQVAEQTSADSGGTLSQALIQLAKQSSANASSVDQAITQIANQVAIEGEDGQVKQFVKQLAKQHAAGNANANQTISQIANQTAAGDNNVVQVIIQIAKQQAIAAPQDTTAAGKTELKSETKVKNETGEGTVEQKEETRVEETDADDNSTGSSD